MVGDGARAVNGVRFGGLDQSVGVLASIGFGDLRTSKVPKQLDLAQRALGQDLLAEDIGDLLDGHSFSRGIILGRAVVGQPRG